MTTVPSLSLTSTVLNRDIDIVSDWPALIADYLKNGNEWLPGIPDNTLELCKSALPQFSVDHNTLYYHLSDVMKVPYALPEEREIILARYHDNLGHLKSQSVIDILRNRFWWPTLLEDLQAFIQRCPRCQLQASSNAGPNPAPARPLPPCALPFERCGVDFVQNLPLTKAGNRHIITAIDYATRWPIAKAVPSMDAGTVVAFLYDLIRDYGAPFEIVTYRGSNFLETVGFVEAMQDGSQDVELLVEEVSLDQGMSHN